MWTQCSSTTRGDGRPSGTGEEKNKDSSRRFPRFAKSRQAGRQAGRGAARVSVFFLNWSTLLLPTSSRSVCLRLRLRLRLGDVSLRFVSCTEAKWMGTADLYRTSLGSLYLRLFTVTYLSNMRVCRHVCVCVLWCWIVSRLYVVCVSCCCCLVQRVLGSQSGVGVIL